MAPSRPWSRSPAGPCLSDDQSGHGSYALFEEASELLGHHTGQRREHDGCAIVTRYRHMTPEMQARVLPVIDQHLATMEASIMNP
jgi:hypothetical protein